MSNLVIGVDPGKGIPPMDRWYDFSKKEKSCLKDTPVLTHTALAGIGNDAGVVSVLPHSARTDISAEKMDLIRAHGTARSTSTRITGVGVLSVWRPLPLRALRPSPLRKLVTGKACIDTLVVDVGCVRLV